MKIILIQSVIAANILTGLMNVSIVIDKVNKGQEISSNVALIKLYIVFTAFLTVALTKNIKEQRYLKQNTEYQQLTKGCQGCKYFHGTDGIICATHPRGQLNCSDFSQR